METTMQRTSPQFSCFPKPAHRLIPGFEQLVRNVLKDARGFYKTSGMTCADITRELRRVAVTYVGSADAVTPQRVGSALAKLRRRGFISNDGQSPRHWRIA
ncbi:MAG TPA: hypothetical protein VF761_16920 [Gemmatimonadaceae bacterium]